MDDSEPTKTATKQTIDADYQVEEGGERKKLKTNGHHLEQVYSLSDSPTKQYSELAIKQSYYDDIDILKKLYKSKLDNLSKESFLGENCHIIRDPFQVIQFKQFVQNDKVLKALKQHIASIELNIKDNDLLSLKQSSDLKNYAEFKGVCDFFSRQVRPFLQDVTGLQLNSNVALTVSRYDENDYLLCHDDQLEERKIAFILYLVDEDWTESDGGQLELFECNSDNQPLNITQRLIPEWNLFNFFVVQPFTYHQVSEVVSTKTRWSINGWFHSDDVLVVPRNYSFPVISTIRNAIGIDAKNAIAYEVLVSWINPRYLVDDLQSDVQQFFADSSEVQLDNFLNQSKFDQLSQALQNEEMHQWWKRNYCPVLSRYEYIPEDILRPSSEKASSSDIPDIIREAFTLFCSEAFFLVLSNLTGIRMHNLAAIANSEEDNSNKPDCTSTCRGEVRRWQYGDYTLSSDIAPEIEEEAAIDFMLFLNVQTDQPKEDSNKPENATSLEENKPSSSKSMSKAGASGSKGVVISRNKVPVESSDDTDDDSLDELNNVINDDDEEEDLSYSDDSEEEEDNADEAYVHYIDDESDEPLMKVKPTNNNLNLIYRTKGTQRIMKYINSRNKSVPFNEISFVFYP